MAALTAATLEADAAEIDVDLVVYHDHVGGRDREVLGHRRDRAAGDVHEAARPSEDHGPPGEPGLGDLAVRLLVRREARRHRQCARGEFEDHVPADVVAGGLVVGSGVGQADYGSGAGAVSGTHAGHDPTPGARAPWCARAAPTRVCPDPWPRGNGGSRTRLNVCGCSGRARRRPGSGRVGEGEDHSSSAASSSEDSSLSSSCDSSIAPATSSSSSAARSSSVGASITLTISVSGSETMVTPDGSSMSAAVTWWPASASSTETVKPSGILSASASIST